jgi:hypothetical protein
MLPNVSTAVIIMELRNRVGDFVYDPEPQYDVALDGLDVDMLKRLHTYLKAATKTPSTEPEEV